MFRFDVYDVNKSEGLDVKTHHNFTWYGDLLQIFVIFFAVPYADTDATQEISHLHFG